MEAAVVLPILISIFAGVFYVERVWESKQAALLAARKCAWEYSNSGCSQVPTGCKGVVSRARDSKIDNRINSEMKGGVLTDLSRLPIIGAVVEGLFGSALEAGASSKVERPAVFGGGAVRVQGYYYLMCNEKSRDMGEVLKSVFFGFICRDFPGFPGC